MNNVKYVKFANLDGTATEWAIIDRGNDEYTSMPKSAYDDQQAALSTPMVTVDEAETI